MEKLNYFCGNPSFLSRDECYMQSGAVHINLYIYSHLKAFTVNPYILNPCYAE